LLKYIYDYGSLGFEKEDFAKRKRIKSITPHYLRCTAKRANGEQCTRRKKLELGFCGTHDKNRPHGEISNVESTEPELLKRDVWLQEINGVLYYIDNFNNIYTTTDIMLNNTNPSIMGKYKLENLVYSMVI